ncbi:unnamed protein product [Phyllotreta striolata]|uniref:Torsin n=1 Tax=Phyllotreta striolata TaxID=444603 RepID=A0A9N9TSP8_PHYSR|nr:unnamed protein product [Phyllotreta striolata]
MWLNYKSTFLIIVLMWLKCVKPWSYNPLCLVQECCNDDYIINDIKGLYSTIKSKIYGQHLVEVAIDAISSHIHFKPPKPLTLSFHGWAGSGKNYVSSFIVDHLYKRGFKSNYIHNFIGRIHFPEDSHAKQYKDNLYSWLKGNLTSCSRQLFIFDEVHLMPPSVLNAVKPLIDYRTNVDKIDYTQAIFIFLSNTGATLVNERYNELWSKGIQREDMKLSHFDSLISKGAFNEEGGFHFSDTIRANLIDHYIPFLPMQVNHVIDCIKDQFRERGVASPQQTHIDEILEYIEWAPADTKLYSKTGCKRISSLVAVAVAKHYRHTQKREL